MCTTCISSIGQVIILVLLETCCVIVFCSLVVLVFLVIHFSGEEGFIPELSVVVTVVKVEVDSDTTG